MKRLQNMSGSAVERLKEELKDARSEANECSQRISTLEYQNYVSISIIDQGPGINEPDMMKIFDRFYSLRENDENSQIHSGLGLSISKQIIDAHDGYISVDNLTSENGTVGAKFIINLPLSNNKK